MPTPQGRRETIITDLKNLLENITQANGFNSSYQAVRIWDDIPVQYTRNEIFIRDPRATFEKKSRYESTVRIEILAIIVETSTASASELGNLALEDLIKAVLSLRTCKAIVTLISADKFIETKGKTACEIDLQIDVKYVIN